MTSVKKPHADEKCICVCFAHVYVQTPFLLQGIVCGELNPMYRRTLHFVWEQKLMIVYVSLKLEVFHEIFSCQILLSLIT